jgi:glycosyltransferase involved in cell wall biosynthesis
MQLVDSLDVGGAERVAVNLANLLPRDRYRAYLGTTRKDGPLAELVGSDVGRLSLGRRRRFDLGALRRLVGFIRRNDIRVLHAHGTSLLTAALASLAPPHPAVVWHDHYGRDVGERPVWIYRALARRASAVIAVNQGLADWATEALRVPSGRVRYLANFVCEPPPGPPAADLPGRAGSRLVCVANFRPQKDHLSLLRAMTTVARNVPEAHLLLVGADGEAAYRASVVRAVEELGLGRHVSVLGQRSDVPAVLRGSDVGVLSSASEGLPLALIEYGMAGLAAVATSVGQCPDVLDEGRAGLLVPPGSPERLAEALVVLLRDPARRSALGAGLAARVRDRHGARAALDRVGEVYEEAVRLRTQS